MCANSSFDMFDINALALMEPGTAHVGDHNGLLFCQDHSVAASLIPMCPSSSSSSLAGDQHGWTFQTRDSLWASQDLPVKPDESFQPPFLHEATGPITRNDIDNLSSFTQDNSLFHPLGGLDISCSETNLYGGSIPQGRVDKKEPDCDYSSDEMDDLKDEDEKAGSQDGRSSQPKTLLLERRRRGQLNERLYTLRSLVPKITKMDKASIVGDAISYVEGLQRELKDIRNEIEELRSNVSRQIESTTLERSNSAGSDLDYEMQPYEEGNGNSPTSKEALTLSIIEVNVSQIKDRMFHIKIDCQKNPGVLVRLMRALESIQLDFQNASVSSVDGHMIKTAIVKIKKVHGPMEADALKGAILEAASHHGFRST